MMNPNCFILTSECLHWGICICSVPFNYLTKLIFEILCRIVANQGHNVWPSPSFVGSYKCGLWLVAWDDACHCYWVVNNSKGDFVYYRHADHHFIFIFIFLQVFFNVINYKHQPTPAVKLIPKPWTCEWANLLHRVRWSENQLDRTNSKWMRGWGDKKYEMAKEDNFKSKLKNLFGIKERSHAAAFHRPPTKELLFTPETLKVR